MILSAAMRGVRLHGLDGVRIQHIAQLAGVSAGSIYGYFDGKQTLLRSCFEQVDRRIAQIFDQVKPTLAALQADPEGEIRALWSAYYRWLVEHPDETVFYHRFRDNPGFPAYERMRDVSYFASFVETVKAMQQLYHIFDGLAHNVFWLHVLTCTVLYAKYVAEGVLEDDALTQESVFRMIMGGIRGVMQAPHTTGDCQRAAPETA